MPRRILHFFQTRRGAARLFGWGTVLSFWVGFFEEKQREKPTMIILFVCVCVGLVVLKRKQEESSTILGNSPKQKDTPVHPNEMHLFIIIIIYFFVCHVLQDY